MIPYKTYPMHEKVQKEKHFLVKNGQSTKQRNY